MKVYMIRHGQSVNNLENKWTGWMDVPLTDKGRAEAKEAGKVLSSISFDRVYSSDLSRAIETAKLAIPGCEPEITPLAREVNVGTLSGTSIDLSDEMIKLLTPKRDYSVFEGESFEQFNARISKLMQFLENSGCETVAVFAHGGVLRTMLRLVLDAPLPAKKFLCHNCCIMRFDCNNSSWALHSVINQN